MSVDNTIQEIGYDGQTLWTRYMTSTKFTFIINNLDALQAKTELINDGETSITIKEAEIRENVARFETWLRSKIGN